LPEDNLCNIRGFGKRSVLEIKEKLKNLNMCLGMKTEEDYERALESFFPTMVKSESQYGEYEFYPVGGFTLLDYFAGQALAGIIASDCSDKMAVEPRARLAYRIADAMLTARKNHIAAIWNEVPGLGKDDELEKAKENEE
jgi:hypothetical protein